jgi:uncharacterized membrane protein YccC
LTARTSFDIVRWLRRRRAELQFGTRITVAGVAAFALAELVSLPQSYWAVFTAVLVTQASVGGSLTAARDRLVGTLGGAAYSALIAVLIPHNEPISLGAALAISLAPLAALAAINPVFRVAPVTAVIILLGSAGVQEGPVLAALLRTLEVTFGGIVGLAVSVLVLPKRGSTVMFETAGRILTLLAGLMANLLNGLLAQLDSPAISRQHEGIQSAFDKMETAAAEAAREHRTFLSAHEDLAPLPRTLRRIYHDLVLVGRVAARPLAGTDTATVALAVEQGRAFLLGIGTALAQRQPPPATDGLDDALRALAAHSETEYGGNGDDSSRRAVLNFALEQLLRDIADLAARAQEFAKPLIR